CTRDQVDYGTNYVGGFDYW
nr:immunoglobulin heavy chain junction region [Macaca mulatta]MOV36476.1 immunoglobulin heavy chain junction region [Macaca mulatta]